MARLGGMVLSMESAGEYSSAAKGETLEGNVLLCRSEVGFMSGCLWLWCM